jgi:hypothetical protein
MEAGPGSSKQKSKNHIKTDTANSSGLTMLTGETFTL